MRIIGIDPGSRITGYGVIELNKGKPLYIASGAIHTRTVDVLSEKLWLIFQGIQEVVHTYQPNKAAVEEVFMHKNANSALKLGQARGAALTALASKDLAVTAYTPRKIKQTVVGYGAADKNQIQKMIQRLLCLSSLPQVDAADALAVAYCHSLTGEYTL